MRDSPAVPAGSPNQSLGGGRSLGIAYLNNSPVDVIHADISMAFDGQDGRTGHIRAVVTGTSITWASWNFFDEGAATWTLPRANTIGVSTGKFIHTGGPILQQEVDANARKSNNADTGSSWTSGFSLPAVIDGSMLNQDNALAFAPLANNVMLAVYDNGQNVEPNQTNLRYKRSNANGVWPGITVGSQLGGDGNVFATNAVINQNDWALVPVSTSQIFVFRRKANGTGVDAASYNVASQQLVVDVAGAAGVWRGPVVQVRRWAVWHNGRNQRLALRDQHRRGEFSPVYDGSTVPPGRHGRRLPAPRSASRTATTFPALPWLATTRSA